MAADREAPQERHDRRRDPPLVEAELPLTKAGPRLTVGHRNSRSAKAYGRSKRCRGWIQGPGGRFGFLGNGAGKTTTIKILLGMARATSGTARVFGLAAGSPQSSVEIRRRSGFVSDEKDLYDNFTVDGIIRFTAPFYPKWRADLEKKYLHKFDLPADRKIKALSRGMRTKLALLLALSRGAELLILDEPTSGLDPAITEEVLQVLVSHVAAEEMSVFFSSHHERGRSDRRSIAIIHRGRAVWRRGARELPPTSSGVDGRRRAASRPRACRSARDGA